MSVGRDFGPTAWPGHDAQGERIEGEKRVDVKDWGGVMRGFWGANRGLVLIVKVRIEMTNFELPKKMESCLAALSRLYLKSGEPELREIVVNGRVKIIEEWHYDNWNGGTYGHAITFTLAESSYLELLNKVDEMRQRICQDLNRLCNVQNEHISEVFIEVGLEDDPNWRAGTGIFKPHSSGALLSDDVVKRIWGEENIKVFISHKSTSKKEANDLKISLRSYGVAAFVAHEDIEPNEEWVQEIERALFSMDAIVALLTDDFYDSHWTDQEVGVAMGRAVPVVAVRLGNDPRGLMGKRQGLGGCDLADTNTIAKKIYAILYKRLSDNSVLVDFAIQTYSDSGSFAHSATILRTLFDIFERLTPRQIENVIAAFENNPQNRHSWDGKEILLNLLAKWTDKEWEESGGKLVPKINQETDGIPF